MISFKPNSFVEYDSIINWYTNVNSYNFSIVPSIDFLYVSISFDDMPVFSLDSFIRSHFRVFSFRKGRNQDRPYYEIGVVIGGAFYRACCYAIKVYERIIFQFKDIDKVFVEYLLTVFNSVNYHVSKVEFTFDFYSSNNISLYTFFANTLILNKAGLLFHHKPYTTTRYLNSVRKTKGIGGKTYLKLTKRDWPARIEATLSRPKLSKIGVSDILSVVTLHPKVIFEKFEFKYFDHAKYANKYSVNEDFEDAFICILNGGHNCGGMVALRKYIAEIESDPYCCFEKHVFNDYFHQLIQQPVYADMFC